MWVRNHAECDPKNVGWMAAAVVVLGIFTAIGAAGAEETLASRSRPQFSLSQPPRLRCPSKLQSSEALPPNSFVRLRGLPPSVSLIEGFAIGPGVWAVPLFGLATLKVNVPVDVSGQSNFLVTLVDMEGTILAEATSALIVGPGSCLRLPTRSRQLP